MPMDKFSLTETPARGDKAAAADLNHQLKAYNHSLLDLPFCQSHGESMLDKLLKAGGASRSRNSPEGDQDDKDVDSAVSSVYHDILGLGSDGLEEDDEDGDGGGRDVPPHGESHFDCDSSSWPIRPIRSMATKNDGGKAQNEAQSQVAADQAFIDSNQGSVARRVSKGGAVSREQVDIRSASANKYDSPFHPERPANNVCLKDWTIPSRTSAFLVGHQQEVDNEVQHANQDRIRDRDPGLGNISTDAIMTNPLDRPALSGICRLHCAPGPSHDAIGATDRDDIFSGKRPASENELGRPSKRPCHKMGGTAELQHYHELQKMVDSPDDEYARSSILGLVIVTPDPVYGVWYTDAGSSIRGLVYRRQIQYTASALPPGPQNSLVSHLRYSYSEAMATTTAIKEFTSIHSGAKAG
ncbi:Uu.00g053010.m01.CDS01 [Anthostomella pinea]|uniref:Uu.00g053010.m01.CDS01 n=1 Tax=Anthostomella pinea TaxID=933095 RepID=A0AAI8VWD7_9PEZI|nr:Uu.00g053010.m01.CDS01 [Anthostomella pinea]